MKRIIVFCVDKFRRLKHYVSTFILKHQLVAYGDHVGAARYIKISRRFFVKFGGNLFFISTVSLFFFLNPIKSCRYVCFLVTLKTPHH